MMTITFNPITRVTLEEFADSHKLGNLTITETTVGRYQAVLEKATHCGFGDSPRAAIVDLANRLQLNNPCLIDASQTPLPPEAEAVDPKENKNRTFPKVDKGRGWRG